MTELRVFASFALFSALLGGCVPTSSNCDVNPGATFSVEDNPEVELTTEECETMCRDEVMGAYPPDSVIVACYYEDGTDDVANYYCEWEDAYACDEGDSTPVVSEDYPSRM